MDAAIFKYNPGVMGDDELVRSFVVRHKCLELILEALKENAGSASANRHLLVVGPRGIGKTMLVRRVAAEVRSNPEYGRVWFPIVFGEESYQVSSAGEFWLEALFHLSDQIGGRKLDSTLEELRGEQKDSRLRERALAQLRDFAGSQGKRLLVIVENLNMLCEQITSDAAWELRHTLTNEPRIMLLGTATSRFDAITHADKAWFELFGVHELKPLDRKESHTLWQSVADQDLKPGHVRAVRILTGGNPRLLAVLAGFAAKHSFRELMEQLVHLIDDHTEYFKGHLDVLPPKERKVFVGLLEQWNPVAAADLARSGRMSVNEVSALLNRLVSRGAVELFEQRPRRKVYQAAERLYNIYYLMRRRGQPADRVRAAVSFMVMFYGGRQLATTIADLAKEACGLPAGKREDHFVAYAELARRAPFQVWAHVLEHTPPEFFDCPDAPESVRKLTKVSKVNAILKRASELVRAEKWSQAERPLREVIALDSSLAWAWINLGIVLEELGRLEEAETAYRKSIELNSRHGSRYLGRLLAGLGRREEAEQSYRAAIDQDPKDACAWHYLGRLLSELERHEEAVQACQTATDLDSKHLGAWIDFGNALRECGQLEIAKRKYRRAIELDPNSVWAWGGLGLALKEQNRYEEAREAYQTAIRLDPTVPVFWDEFGHLVSDFGPPAEAEKVWGEALHLHPILAPCAVHLLEAKLQRGVAAAAILGEAGEWIERSGRTARTLGAMSLLVLRLNLTKSLPLAEKWAREGASKEPQERVSETLALICAAQGKWTEALEAASSVLDAAADFEDAQEIATDFLIQAAAAGYAQEALKLLAASKGADALEPLLVGLQVYLGETPQVAKEIQEIAQDVAERIREVERANKKTPTSSAPEPRRPASSAGRPKAAKRRPRGRPV